MKVTIYSKPDCPWCNKAKAFLLDRSMHYDEVVLEEVADRQALYDRLRLQGMERAVPQVILTDDDGEELRIGGWDKLVSSGIASLGILGLGMEAIEGAGMDEVQVRREAAAMEPVFTLRAPDQFAVDTVEFWISKALPGLGEGHPKIRSARRRVEQMKAWQEIYGQRHPD